MCSMDIKIVLEKAGGIRVVAQELGLSTQAVYGWRKVPSRHVIKVARMAKLKPEDVAPEMFA